jgi:hypothetical protein
MASKARMLCPGVLALTFCTCGTAGTIVGWYNGDPVDQFNIGLINGENSPYPVANVYEDFIVPTGGWTIAGAFSYDELNFTPGTQAEWEIRSGMSSGDGGTLIASGTQTASYTSTGESGSGQVLYKVEVDGLNVPLTAGTYWLSVAPVGCGSGCLSAVDYTTGANAIGNPPGNDLDNFQNVPALTGHDFLFDPTSVGSARDWSLGVLIRTGTPTPEPATFGAIPLMILLACAGGIFRNSWRQSKLRV